LWRENKPESTPFRPLRCCQASLVIPACQDLAPGSKLRSTKPFRPQKGNFMEPLIPIVVLVVLGVPLALAIWLIVRAVQAKGRIEELSFRLSELEAEVIRLKRESAKPVEPMASVKATAPVLTPQPPVATPAPPPSTQVIEPGIVPESPFEEIAPGVFGMPPAVPITSSKPEPEVFKQPVPPMIAAASTIPKPAPAVPRPTAPAINWEQFLGVKGFAWLGGLAFFLFIAFAIKYSFDHNLISPELRMAFGFLTGLALLVGGTWLQRRKQYTVGAQTLCATGVVILYAVTFACRSIYHFLSWPDTWWDALPSFAIMVLLTLA
jgi:uncharacterized membrane protein